MSSNNAIKLFKSLPQELQREATHFIEFLASKVRKQEMPEAKKRPSYFGHEKGKVHMAPDWNEPLEDFKDYR